MGEPLISPWLIYLAGVCDLVSKISVTFFIILLAVAIFLGVGLIFEEDEESIKKLSTGFKVTVFTVMTLLLVVLFVPRKETIISMAVANVVTKENINLTRNEILSLITDIKGILEKDKK